MKHALRLCFFATLVIALLTACSPDEDNDFDVNEYEPNNRQRNVDIHDQNREFAPDMYDEERDVYRRDTAPNRMQNDDVDTEAYEQNDRNVENKDDADR